jgi:hypothetical protein
VWRSQVAHLVRDEGVAGSNPATPTNLSAENSASCTTGTEACQGSPGQLSGQKRYSRLSPPSAAPLRIVIDPTVSGRKWIARLGDRVLCRCTSPFITSARLLLVEGHPADAVIEMWRPNTDAWALRGHLGAVAATIIDGETASRLRQERLAGSRSREERPLRPVAGPRSSSGRFWRGR